VKREAGHDKKRKLCFRFLCCARGRAAGRGRARVQQIAEMDFRYLSDLRRLSADNGKQFPLSGMSSRHARLRAANSGNGLPLSACFAPAQAR